MDYCKQCGKRIIQNKRGHKKLFCSNTCRAINRKLVHETMFNKTNPEDFIKQELNKEVQQKEDIKDYVNEINFPYVITTLGIQLKLINKNIRILDIKHGDVVDIKIKVIKRYGH